jgi:hypothetical protein
MTPGLQRAVWLLNTGGLVFYLVWLATMGDRQILREQEGIVFFLPTIPFFFVFMLLIEPKPKPPAADSAGPRAPQTHDDSHDLS